MPVCHFAFEVFVLNGWLPSEGGQIVKHLLILCELKSGFDPLVSLNEQISTMDNRRKVYRRTNLDDLGVH